MNTPPERRLLDVQAGTTVWVPWCWYADAMHAGRGGQPLYKPTPRGTLFRLGIRELLSS